MDVRLLRKLFVTLFWTMLTCLPTVVFGQGQVNFYNWGAYINPDIIPQFQKATGITVNQTFYDSAEMMRAKLMAGDSGVDVALVASIDLPDMIRAGLFQPLDKIKIPNLSHQNSALYRKVQGVDPGNQYGVIYAYGTTGIVYNEAMIKKILGPHVKIDSWKFLFEPKYLKKLQSCGVSFLDDEVEIFGIMLMYLHKDPNSISPADFEAAAKALMKVRPYLMYFSNNNYMNDLASGNLCIAIGYSGDVLQAVRAARSANDGVHLKYVIPQEGAPVWFDMLAVPNDAPDSDEAWTFINYLLNPKISAENSNFIFEPTATEGASQYWVKILKNPDFNPGGAVMKRLRLIQRPPLDLKPLIDKLWFQVKYGVRLG